MASKLVFFVAIIAMLVAVVIMQLGEDKDLAKRDIKVISELDLIENILSKYSRQIGADMPGYKNHIYRVLSYTMHFLDNDDRHLRTIATALVYHDIGLWTAGTMAYLEPSASLAQRDAEKGDKKFSAEKLQLQADIINFHHKIRPFHGANAEVVEAVRKADWIDATNGIFNMGMPRKHIAKVVAAIPAQGFYETLAGFGPRLYGTDYLKMIKKISTIYKW